MKQHKTDILIIGLGLAGMTAAITAAKSGKKITIMLEEIDFKYKITKININKDEQFEPEFQKISPIRKYKKVSACLI